MRMYDCWQGSTIGNEYARELSSQDHFKNKAGNGQIDLVTDKDVRQ